MNVLLVFDMDGTLLHGTTATVQIATALDRLPDLIELEQSFAAGALSTYDFAVAAFELYQGLTTTLVADIFARSPWLTGIAEVMADIRARGERSLVVTMSPNFFAELLRTHGVDQVRASTFPPLPLRELPVREAILTPADKVSIVEEALAAANVDPDRCVAYGDSASDLPLFGLLRHTVAVNATPQLRRIAAVASDGTDLWPPYRAGRALLTA